MVSRRHPKANPNHKVSNRWFMLRFTGHHRDHTISLVSCQSNASNYMHFFESVFDEYCLNVCLCKSSLSNHQLVFTCV